MVDAPLPFSQLPASLIKSAVQNSTIPIIETGAGNCHVYVDEFADIEKAVKIIYNAKTQRYSVCNACESLVIHSNILEKALPKIYEKLKEKEVKFYCDERALPFVKDGILASSEDFYTEYLGPSISVKVVDSLDEAISHINEHSTHHSESIVTENKEVKTEASEYISKYDELDELLDIYAGLDNGKLALYNLFNDNSMEEFDDEEYDLWLEDMKNEHFDELFATLKEMDEEQEYYMNKINENKEVKTEAAEFNQDNMSNIEDAIREMGIKNETA